MRGKWGWRFASAVLAAALAGATWAAGASGAALVADLEGDVRISVSGEKSQAIAPGQRVESGSRVTTGAGSRVVLRFDDGLWAALHEDSELHIEAYRFRAQEPAGDRSVFVLLKGALRFVTGVLGRRNPEAFTLRTSKLVIGIRGTDFMVAIANPVYLSVLEGRVTATNGGGTATFGAGALGAAATDAALAAAVRADTLPDVVSSAFGRLGALRLLRAAPDADDRIRPPRDASPRAPAADFGRDAASRARELKGRLRDPDSKPGAK